ncbi:uncharacterized protein G2W53_021856 [Senna tora]|uniref:Uncharacterized protein n=1 Tax=Senna tora TaxID=362788 RepID=A0A834TLR0_9FABA|nr:uncharacterized protein G2W53_021856 [Senna tora]
MGFSHQHSPSGLPWVSKPFDFKNENFPAFSLVQGLIYKSQRISHSRNTTSNQIFRLQSPKFGISIRGMVFKDLLGLGHDLDSGGGHDPLALILGGLRPMFCWVATPGPKVQSQGRGASFLGGSNLKVAVSSESRGRNASLEGNSVDVMPRPSRGRDASFLGKYTFEVTMPRQSRGLDASSLEKFNFEVAMAHQSRGHDASFLEKFNFEVVMPCQS